MIKCAPRSSAGPGGLPKERRPADFCTVSYLRNPNIANLMQRIDYIEKMGTGIRRMQNLLKEAGLAPLRYEFSGFVRAVFLRTQQATQQVDSDKMETILAFCQEPKSREEIMQKLRLNDREYFRSGILQPLIEAGLLVLTIPDKPKVSVKSPLSLNHIPWQ